jgi:hypothetical protein
MPGGHQPGMDKSIPVHAFVAVGDVQEEVVVVVFLAKSKQKRTVRWSNFDRRDPKMGVFLQRTEATPCGHILK